MIKIIRDINDLNQAIIEYKYEQLSKEELKRKLKFYKDKIEAIENQLEED